MCWNNCKLEQNFGWTKLMTYWSVDTFYWHRLIGCFGLSMYHSARIWSFDIRVPCIDARLTSHHCHDAATGADTLCVNLVSVHTQCSHLALANTDLFVNTLMLVYRHFTESFTRDSVSPGYVHFLSLNYFSFMHARSLLHSHKAGSQSFG